MPKDKSSNTSKNNSGEFELSCVTHISQITELEKKLHQIEKCVNAIEFQLRDSTEKSSRTIYDLQRQLINIHEYSNHVADILNAQYNQAYLDKNHLQWLLTAVYDSTCWKITGPLRSLGDFVKNIQRKCGSIAHFLTEVLVGFLTLRPLRLLLSRKRSNTKDSAQTPMQKQPTLPVTPEDTDRLGHDITRQTLPKRAQTIYKKLVEECYL